MTQHALRQIFTLALAFLCLGAIRANAQTFFFVGPAGGDFFDEANWNSAADGSGVIPAGDPIVDSSTNAIELDLIIDGDTVVADGQVDFGTGSLDMQSGSMLSITAISGDLDINAASTFSFTDATLVVDDIINFEGNSTFSGGSVTSITDDIAFQNNFINLTIDGTTFTSADTTYFDGPTPGSITNATFIVVDQFGLRNDDPNDPQDPALAANVVMTNTSIDVQANGGTSGGDIQNIFNGDAVGSSLTLLGSSTLRADAIEEGAKLFLGDSASATLGVHFEERIVDEGATITLESLDAVLNVVALDETALEYVDARPFLINGGTGLSYAQDDSTWNVQGWNGFDAESLSLTSLVPEPSSAVLCISMLAAFAIRRPSSK